MIYYKPSLSILVLSSLLLMTGCANDFKKFYQPMSGATPEAIASTRAGPPPATPIIERSPPSDPKPILASYNRRGYSLIGYSQFNSGESVSEEDAIKQGREVGADLVLILNPKYTGSETSSYLLTLPNTTTSYTTGSATVYGSNGPVTAYGNGTTTTYGTTTTEIPFTIQRSDYGAVYFVKRHYSLGIQYEALSDAQRQELQTNKGVVITSVVDGSPAFEADILVGDIITSINKLSISDQKSLSDIILSNSGKLISLSIVRKGKQIDKSVQLNP